MVVLTKKKGELSFHPVVFSDQDRREGRNPVEIVQEKIRDGIFIVQIGKPRIGVDKNGVASLELPKIGSDEIKLQGSLSHHIPGIDHFIQEKI